MENLKQKLLGLILYLIAAIWTYLSTNFYSSNKLDSLLSGDLLVYLPFFLSTLLIFISSYEYLMCKNRKKCEDTNSLKIGFFAGSITFASILFIIEGIFRLSRFYILFESEYIIESFILFNPLLIFYFFYQVILYLFFDKGIIEEIEEEIL